MGAVVTLELPEDSPVLAMPWIITFGPLRDEEEWEPVVCGPYERPHALGLAESVVADEDLMAVVEPLLPHVSVDEIRGEIAASRLATEDDSNGYGSNGYGGDDVATADEDYRAASSGTAGLGGTGGLGGGGLGDGGLGGAGALRGAAGLDRAGGLGGGGLGGAGGLGGGRVEPSKPPTAEEVRAGMARIATRFG